MSWVQNLNSFNCHDKKIYVGVLRYRHITQIRRKIIIIFSESFQLWTNERDQWCHEGEAGANQNLQELIPIWIFMAHSLPAYWIYFSNIFEIFNEINTAMRNWSISLSSLYLDLQDGPAMTFLSGKPKWLYTRLTQISNLIQISWFSFLHMRLMEISGAWLEDIS